MIRVLENNFSSQYRMHNCKKASLEGIKLIQVPNNGFWIEVVSVRIVKGILEVETTELCGKYDIGVRWKKDVVFKFCVWLIKCNIMVFKKKTVYVSMRTISEEVIMTSSFYLVASEHFCRMLRQLCGR